MFYYNALYSVRFQPAVRFRADIGYADLIIGIICSPSWGCMSLYMKALRPGRPG